MDNNKSKTEFENIANEAVEKNPVVNDESDNNQNQGEVKDTTQLNSSEEKKEDQLEEQKIELPQKNNEVSSTIPSVDLSQNSAQTIGTLKPDKQKSPIAMIVLFGLLILFIMFMPTAISLFNKYFGTNLNVNPINTPTSNSEVNNNNNEKQDIRMYPLSKDTVITLDKIEFSGFNKDNANGYLLSFSVKNTGTVLYSFEKKLYLEYYDDNNTFVGRSYLEMIKEVSGGVTNNYNIDISEEIYNKATKLEIIERTEDDYPNVNLSNNQLTCENNTNNIVYTFKTDMKLTSIKDMFTYKKGSDLIEYNNDLLSYKTKMSNLDMQNGVTAILTENESGFITTVAIDYSIADNFKSTTNNDYYNKDTDAKVISFEMNAKGYTCR